MFAVVVQAALPYLMPKSGCMQRLKEALASQRNEDEATMSLMLLAWNAAQDPKQPPKDRALVMYNVVNWLHEEDYSAEARQRFPVALKALEDVKKDEEVAVLLTSQAEEFARLGQHDQAVRAIERSLSIKQKFPANVLSIASTLSVMPQLYLAVHDLKKAKSSNVRLTNLIEHAASPKWNPERKGYYTSLANLNEACIAAANKDDSQAEASFATSVNWTDGQYGTGNRSSELALLTFAKALKNAELNARADFYNSKLDVPLDFSAPDWRTRYRPYPN